MDDGPVTLTRTAVARSIERAGACRAPLSPAQEGLLTIHGLLGRDASRLLNSSGMVRMRGPLDLGLLAHAATAVVARHEVLRTSYELTGPRAQVVGDPWPVDIRRTDILSRDTGAALDQAVDVVRGAATSPFDPSTPRPLRLDAVRLAPDDHVLGVAVDHLACDPPSLAIFLTETLTAYACQRDLGVPPALPPLPIQYADYARWQRARSDDVTQVARHQAYWAEKLEGVASLGLPLGLARTSGWDLRGHVLRFTVDRPRCAGLARLAASQRATVFAAVLGSVAHALAGACDADEVTVATLPAHRPRPECRHLVGLFANLTLLRMIGVRGSAWPAIVAEARDTTVDALTHGELAFGDLVKVPGVLQLLDRTRSFWPLVHFVDDLGHGGLGGSNGTTEVPGLSTSSLAGSASRDGEVQPMLPVDVHLVFRDRGDHMVGELRCNTGVFDRQAASGLGHALDAALGAAAKACTP